MQPNNRTTNRAIRRALGCLALLIASIALPERLPIKSYTLADGLGSDHINRVFQDSRGFMWFCTRDGLSRYDGYSFVTYGTEDGLPGEEVDDILEARDGTYWIATYKGLCRLVANPSPGQKKFVAVNPGPDPYTGVFICLCQDRKGDIWGGTDKGLYHLRLSNGPAALIHEPAVTPAPQNDLKVRAIMADREGNVWAGSTSGLVKISAGGGIQRFTAKDGLPVVRSLLEDRDGQIWVGTLDGLYSLVSNPRVGGPVVKRKFTTRDGLASPRILSILQAKDGPLWCSTNLGISRMLAKPNEKGQTFESYGIANGLSDPSVLSIAEDRDENFWLGGDVAGAMRIAADGFTTYGKEDGLQGQGTASVFLDRQGRVCAQTGGPYIDVLAGNRFSSTKLTLPNGLKYWGWGWNQIGFQDSRGGWWLATAQGLLRYGTLRDAAQIPATKPVAIYDKHNGLPASEIFRLFEDSRGDIWISTLGNQDCTLTRWERSTGKFIQYPVSKGVPASAPSSFAEDSHGNVWIGFYAGGLLRFSNGDLKVFDQQDGVPRGFIAAIMPDGPNTVWIASDEEGVARLDNSQSDHPSFTKYTQANGLSSNTTFCLTQDDSGSVYVGTERGLDRIDPPTGQIAHYSTADGLSGSSVILAQRAKDGALWFGTAQGLSRFVPRVQSDSSAPPVRIAALRVADVPYPVSELGQTAIKLADLKPNQNAIDLEFSSINLTPGRAPRYQYMLDGASSMWSAPTTQRTVNYPGLSPGTYRFRVRTLSAKGTPSQQEATVAFTILPPIWRTWWFLTAAGLFVVSAVYLAGRYRVARLIELERVRTRIATDLHDDIGAGLSRMAILTEVVKQQTGPEGGKSEGMLDEIADSARGLVDSMSDIVWSIDPNKDDLNNVMTRVRAFASDVLEPTGIHWQLEASDGLDHVKLSPDQRRHLYLILKEAINNIARHSGARNANLKVSVLHGQLEVEVSDDGKGFTSADSAGLGGNGLKNMAKRASEIGGDLKADSSPKGGARLRFTAKIK